MELRTLKELTPEAIAALAEAFFLPRAAIVSIAAPYEDKREGATYALTCAVNAAIEVLEEVYEDGYALTESKLCRLLSDASRGYSLGAAVFSELVGAENFEYVYGEDFPEE